MILEMLKALKQVIKRLNIFIIYAPNCLSFESCYNTLFLII